MRFFNNLKRYDLTELLEFLIVLVIGSIITIFLLSSICYVYSDLVITSYQCEEAENNKIEIYENILNYSKNL